VGKWGNGIMILVIGTQKKERKEGRNAIMLLIKSIIVKEVNTCACITLYI